MLGCHHRRERAELLSIFDVAVQPVAHRRIVRRGQDAAMAQRARPEFERAVDPADNLVGRERIGDFLDHQPASARRNSIFLRDPKQGRFVGFRPPIRMVGHGPVRLAEQDAVGIERRAQRAARIARRGRHEHLPVARSVEDARIGDAVERDPAAQAQIAHSGLALQVGRDPDHHLFQQGLRAGGDVGEALAFRALEVDRLPAFARRPEQVDEVLRIAALDLAEEIEIAKVERKGAVAGRAQQFAHRRDPGRPAIRGQTHHLIFTLVDGEAEIGGHRRVEEPERMREAQLTQHLYLARPVRALMPGADGERRPFAHAIHRDDRGFLRRRGKEGGRRMALVMLDAPHLPHRNAELRGDQPAHPKLLPQHILHRLGITAPRSGPALEHAGQHAIEFERRFLVEDHRVEIVGRQARAIEAPFDRGQREACVILVPRQPLFLHRRDGYAIDHQRGGAVVIMAGDAEDPHRGFSAPATSQPSFSFRRVRCASQAKGGSSRKYWSVRISPAITPAKAVAKRI